VGKERWIYNARDCLATAQVYEAVRQHMNERMERVYRANMALQGVALGVQLRGIRIDDKARRALIKEFKGEIKRLDEDIERVAGEPLNPRSPAQMKAYLYGKLKLMPQFKDGKVTTEEKALVRIGKRVVPIKDDACTGKDRTERKDTAARIADLALASRAVGKQKGFATAPTEKGRHRGTLSVGGTEAFRFSSHKSHTGKGINLQNVDKRLRLIYVADPGYTLGQADQERAESMVVAFASGDEGYIKAHLESNTHVVVARLLWPDAGWRGEPEYDKSLAKEPNFLRTKSRYDLAKTVQHGLNFLRTPHGISNGTGLPLRESERVYDAYFDAFPGIPVWHEEIIAEVRETGRLIYPGGYERQFFGRRNDRATWREAISSVPQSIIAWTNHIVFHRVYYNMDSEDFQVLNHIHDAILFQSTDPARDEALLLPLLVVEWEIRGRIMVVPWEINWGKNWSKL
jgi:DNA polymerase-1